MDESSKFSNSGFFPGLYSKYKSDRFVVDSITHHFCPLMSKSQFWLFTINNPVSDPVFKDYQYLIYQIEQVQTVHIQGYVVFNTRKMLNTVKAMVPTAHLETRRGTHSQAKEYCSKLESRLDGPYEFGDDSNIVEGQGSRSDLQVAAEKIFGGTSLKTIAEEHHSSYIRYHRGMLAFQQILKPVVPRTWKTVVNYYYGVSGSGKSFRAKTEAGPLAYYKAPGSKWFDYYNGEENVIFDDFRGNWFPISTLLRILDAYPMMVEMKGSSINFAPKTIWITSNIAPDLLYPNVNGFEIQALLRRIENQVYFTEQFIPHLVESESV